MKNIVEAIPEIILASTMVFYSLLVTVNDFKGLNLYLPISLSDATLFGIIGMSLLHLLRNYN